MHQSAHECKKHYANRPSSEPIIWGTKTQPLLSSISFAGVAPSLQIRTTSAKWVHDSQNSRTGERDRGEDKDDFDLNSSKSSHVDKLRRADRRTKIGGEATSILVPIFQRRGTVPDDDECSRELVEIVPEDEMTVSHCLSLSFLRHRCASASRSGVMSRSYYISLIGAGMPIPRST
jgi:hypothetical protein